MSDRIQVVISQIITLLVGKRYEEIVTITGGVRMGADEIRMAIDDYGRTPISPPESAYHLLDIVAVKNVPFDQYSVRMPLWTKEEGRSDLTLEITVKFLPNKTEIELDDIRVL